MTKVVAPLTDAFLASAREVALAHNGLVDQYAARLSYIFEKVDEWAPREPHFGRRWMQVSVPDDDSCDDNEHWAGRSGWSSAPMTLDTVVAHMQSEIVIWDINSRLSVDKFRIIDTNGQVISLQHSFPTRWLMQDFEQELADGREAYVATKESRAAAAKAAKEKKKLENEALRQSAVSKLTPEEMRVLRVRE